MTNDVTSVRDDGKRNKAHTERAEQVYMAYDVTTLDENVLDSHKDCAENKNNNYVTFVSDDRNETEAHKKCAKRNKENKNNIATDDDAPTIVPPVRKPTKVEERKMIGKVIEIMSIAGMENHIYNFGNTIRKQKIWRSYRASPYW